MANYVNKNKEIPREQPANVGYFFGPGYTALGNTISDAWSKNGENIADAWDRIKDEDGFFYVKFCSWILDFAVLIAIAVFGSLFTAIFTVIHTLVLSVFFAIVYIAFGFIWLLDRLYIAIHKIKNACPNPECQASFLIPAYTCDCGRKHTRLVPGKYGILKRRCDCGKKLPTTFLNGREKLSAYCPVCDMHLSGDTKSRQYAIPVIGGPSVGKTCFINMAVDKLIGDVAKKKKWELSFIDAKEQTTFEKIKRGMESGKRPDKTESDALTAYQLMLRLPGEKIGRRIYIYDIAGERFSSSGDITRNNAYTYANGFVFLIDPLSLPLFAGTIDDHEDKVKYGSSDKDFNDILDIMLDNLGRMFKLSAKDILKLNLAVVINKVDIPGLEEKIGEGAVSAYKSSHADCKSLDDARNAVCEAFLTEYEAGNFVRSAKAKFSNVQYFTAASLQKSGKGYTSKGVIEPLMWILEKADSSIKG